MKNTLILASIIAFAINASAVSFTWTVSGIAFGGNILKSDSNVTGYLVYLGNGGSFESSYDVSTIETKLDLVSTISGTNAKGICSAAYNLPSSSTDQNGDVYGCLLAYSNGGKTYYNLSSVTYTISGLTGKENDSLTTWTLPATSQNYTGSKEAATLSAGGGWVAAAAVPEPATGALALAGIALLFKRRKARA